MRNKSDLIVPGFLLAGLALLAFWPVLSSHPLMDDHLFFAWLEETRWGEAIRDRLTSNWIPYFNQMQMYRPFSGIVQVLAYHLFETWWLPYHLLNFLLHALASLMAGLLTFRLTQNLRAGWFAGGLLLLHPRAAPGVSLIYNFYDPLVACLMLIALHSLCSLQRKRHPHPWWNTLGLWGSVALALGTKEVALPLVVVLILGEFLWKHSTLSASSLFCRHAVSLALLIAYLLARNHFVGHPFRTHGHASAFPLPPNAELWALALDGLLLGSCLVGAWIFRSSKWKAALPATSDWMLLWCGLMLWPAVHFCTQATLRPWFFDERYWYVPLVPLSVLAGSLLSHGGSLSALLGASILGFTLPLPVSLRVFLAAIVFVASGPLQLLHRDREIQRVIATLFATALSILLWRQCGAIRIRADEAANVHRQIARVVQETPANQPVALLNFTEETVEPRLSFNGDLQWLLQPPFFLEDLNRRLFFAYPTWDLPPTNRFRDRKTSDLLSELQWGKSVSVYVWREQERELEFVGTGVRSPRVRPSYVSPLEVAMRRTGANDSGLWRSDPFLADPKEYGYIGIRMLLDKIPQRWEDQPITVRWSSDRFASSVAQSLELFLAEPHGKTPSTPIKLSMWLPAGDYVDWLLSGYVTQLTVATDPACRVLSVQLSTNLPTEDLHRGFGVTHYRYPHKKFQQIGETGLVFEP